MKTEEELKQGLLNFARSICEEFPNAGRRMKSSILDIEKNVRENFSIEVVLTVGSDLGEVMSAEAALMNITLRDVEALIEATGEHIKVQKEDGNQEAMASAQKLKKALELELRSGRLREKGISIAKELKGLVGDESIFDPDLAIGIYSGYVEMAKGKKPEKIPELAKNLERAETILKIHSLKDRVMNLSKERKAIMKEARPDETLYDLKKIALAKDIIALKIKRLEKSTMNYENVKEKKDAEVLLEKIKKMIQIGQKDLEWHALAKELGEYFCEAMFPARTHMKSIVQGIFNAG